MKKCPPGFVRRGDKCVKKVNTPIKKSKAAAKRKKESSSSVEEIRSTNLANTNPYAEFYIIGNLIYKAWKSRPDIPSWFSFAKGSPAAVGIEFTESFIDLQFDIAKDISQGKVEGKDQYGQVERERVESPIGFKPIWTPGGFQI